MFIPSFALSSLPLPPHLPFFSLSGPFLFPFPFLLHLSLSVFTSIRLFSPNSSLLRPPFFIPATPRFLYFTAPAPPFFVSRSLHHPFISCSLFFPPFSFSNTPPLHPVSLSLPLYCGCSRLCDQSRGHVLSPDTLRRSARLHKNPSVQFLSLADKHKLAETRTHFFFFLIRKA